MIQLILIYFNIIARGGIMAKREANNTDKVMSGRQTKNTLTKLIQQTISSFPDIHFKENVKYGEKGKDPKQFNITHQIEFTDQNLYWLIDTTSSYKLDRVKGKQFLMEHTKKILLDRGIDSLAYFVVPDNCTSETLKMIEKFNQHIDAKDKVNFFDGAITMSQFSNLLEQKVTNSIEQGKRSNILGEYSEKKLMDAFNNPNNIKLWNNPHDYLTKSPDYSLFEAVLNKLCLNVSQITECKAYTGNTRGSKDDSISKELTTVRDADNKACGKPKTDVLIIIKDDTNQLFQLAISVKLPSNIKGKVTIHQGHMEQLMNDLHSSLPKNSIFQDKNMFSQLKKALLNFQAEGSLKNMDTDSKEFLNTYLSNLNQWLIDYFVFGINNSLLNDHQIANALLIFNPETGTYQVETVSEVERYMLHTKMATFGTPFSWTYPSGKRGREFQVKGPFNLVHTSSLQSKI